MSGRLLSGRPGSGPRLRRCTIALAGLLGLAGCGGGGDSAPELPTGHAPALARVEALPSASSCPNGGRAVALGIDANRNGVLDAAEVASRSELCNGRGGAGGAPALVRTETLTAGAECAAGGLRVLSGIDANRDGVLDAGEAGAQALLCNGAAAAPSVPLLTRVGPAPAGRCTAGGTRIASGEDRNGDGLLADDEIGREQTLCDGGSAALLRLALAPVPAGAVCPGGGQRVRSGLDANGNGVLDDAEVTASGVVCDGAAGADAPAGARGADGLLAWAAEPAGARCPAGGQRLDAGADRNGDGVLDAGEVTSTRFVCEAAAGRPGANAAPALLAVQAEPAGTNCVAGGRRLAAGPDLNGNGVLDAAELRSSGYVCDGARGAGGDGAHALVRVVSAGPSVCPTGGQLVASGLDANRNGSLDDAEVTSLESVCNAGSGATGATGAIGIGGLTVSSVIPPGATCSTGGQSLRRGLDSNRNGVLDAGEVQGTTVVCNGSDSVGFVWTASGGTGLNAAANQGFVTTRAESEAAVTLPASPVAGAIYRISGLGAGGWVLGQRAGQRIELAGSDQHIARTGLYGDWFVRGPAAQWRSLAGSTDLGVVVAGITGDTLRLSYDRGLNWTAASAGTAIWAGVAASASGLRLVAVAAGGQIHTSDDAGATWTARETNRNWSAVASSGDGRRLLAAVSGGLLYRSVDAGVSWTPQESARAWRAVASSRDGQRLLAAVNGGQLHTSSDGGASWTARENSRTWTAVASSASGDRLLAADYGGSLYLSSDGGLSWQPTGPSRGWASVSMSADGGRLVAVADDGTLVASDDGGASWTQRAALGAAAAVVLSADGADALQLIVASTPRWSFGIRGRTSTSDGTDGFLRGGQGSSAELQYLGSGVFLLRGHEGSLFVD